MLFHHHRSYALLERRTEPAESRGSTRAALVAVRERADRNGALEAYALHLAEDRTRLVTIEAWSDARAFEAPGSQDDVGLHAWAATGGLDPTPGDNSALGAIIIDTFRLWRPLVRPVFAFTIRNGRAFDAAPGCISTTVLRASTGIATYARWASTGDFLAAFTSMTGKPASSTAEVNAAAARMTFGIVRPDYHSYELIETGGTRP